jgi:enamine deaminase RidA (YjgF/YER057c/UK114 family)
MKPPRLAADQARTGEGMEKKQINPWSWQDRFGFSQGWRVDGARSVVFLAGQAAISSDGEVVGAGDFEVQTRRTFENLRTVLEQAGASFDDVPKVTAYLTDLTRIQDYARVRDEFITGPPPASTAVEVSSLALPGMLIEVDAIATL